MALQRVSLSLKSVRSAAGCGLVLGIWHIPDVDGRQFEELNLIAPSRMSAIFHLLPDSKYSQWSLHIT